MYRTAAAALCCLGVVCAWPVARARAADAPDLVGTWQVDHDGYNESLTIAMDKGDWSAAGVLRKKGMEVGAWKGIDVKVADGKLTCTQKWSKKPDPTWADDTKLTASASGDKLTFTWDNGGGNSGSREMTRIKAAAGDGSDLVGTWQVDHDGYREAWDIRTDKGQWVVRGLFYNKKGKQVGAWVGADAAFADGKLTCTQKWIMKPEPNWSDNNKLTAQTANDKLDFAWDNGTQSGTREMTKGGK